MMEFSVVLPVYNEAPNLRLLAPILIKVMDSLEKEYEVIFIDDGSTDESFQVLKEIHQGYPKVVRLIRFASNRGLTAAYDAGFKASLGEIVITLDSDLQNPPTDIPLLLEKIGQYDVVCGWRYCRHDRWIKLISSRIANFVRNSLTGENIRDVGCSLRAMRRQYLSRVKLYDGLHRFLPTLLKMEGARVVEVRVSHNPRRFGRSKYNIRNRLLNSLRDLFAVRWMQARQLDYQIIEEIAVEKD